MQKFSLKSLPMIIPCIGHFKKNAHIHGASTKISGETEFVKLVAEDLFVCLFVLKT